MVKSLSLRVRVENDCVGYKHIRGIFVWVDHDKRGAKQADCQHGELEFASSYGDTRWANELVANSQANTDTVNNGSDYYAMGLRYDCRQVDLSDCERMIKTLKSLEGKLSKYDEKHGRFKTVSEFMFRLAIVTKCKYILIQRDNWDYRYKAYDVDWKGKSALEDMEKNS